MAAVAEGVATGNPFVSILSSLRAHWGGVGWGGGGVGAAVMAYGGTIFITRRIRKLKLRPTQHKLYSLAKEWKSGN